MKRVVFAMLVGLISVSVAWAQFFTTDVIVQGSECVGIDCVNGESFGFDTIRLKENNLRIHFQDTSNSGSFPTNDWEITINDSTNGGDSYFAILDRETGRQVFRVDAGAPSNALYVDSAGDVGIGTDNPLVNLHAVDGNTPTLRLEQDGSSGFQAQTWDIAGNEANFFIRDVTNSSQLPFRIKPGADSDSLFIAANNDIGIGTASPSESLHVRRTNGTAQIMVEEASGTETIRELLRLKNNGGNRIVFENTGSSASAATWQITNNADGEFAISCSAFGGGGCTAGNQLELTHLGELIIPDGDITTLNGVINSVSDVNVKDNITPVDGQLVLAKLDAVPVSTWSFKKDKSGTRHLGPMAQDFHKAFGLGKDERYITPLDVAGVALAAVKELREEVAGVKALRAEVQAKDTRIAELEARLATLEVLLKKNR